MDDSVNYVRIILVTYVSRSYSYQYYYRSSLINFICAMRFFDIMSVEISIITSNVTFGLCDVYSEYSVGTYYR
jgi:hypothetical protein